MLVLEASSCKPQGWLLASGLGDPTVASYWLGTKHLLGPEFVSHIPESQNKRLKVFNNKVETWFVNSLSDSDISKDFICRHCNTQSTAGKVKDAVFLLVPLFWLSWISKSPT